MTPKEKALKLIKMFNPHTEVHKIPIYHAKKCALIAVNEILSIDVLIDEDTWVSKTSYLEFWKEVKKELEKI